MFLDIEGISEGDYRPGFPLENFTETFYLIPIFTYVLSSVKSVETPLGPRLFCLCLKVLIIRIENACSWSEWVIPVCGVPTSRRLLSSL